jgi:hypothetical protein
MLHRLILMLLLSAFIGQVALADELTTAKKEDIKRLMEVTGATNIAKQFASAISQQIFQTLKAAGTKIPDRALAVMDTELTSLFSEKMSVPGGFIDQIIPIYDKYFTHQDVREMLAFYQTPIGQKAISVLPAVTNECTLAGQRWGQSLGPELDQRVLSALKREELLPKGQ